MDSHEEINEVSISTSLLNRELFDYGRKHFSLPSISTVNARNGLFRYIQQRYSGTNWSTSFINLVNREIYNFSSALTKKWSKSCRNINKFTKLYSEWLDMEFQMPINKTKPSISKAGRHSLPFDKCTERTKRLKIKTLESNIKLTSPEIVGLSQRKIHTSGQRSVVQLFKEATVSPKRAKKIKHIYKNSNDIKPIPYSADEALAFFVDNNLSKQQYVNIRLSAKKRNADIYPPYDLILTAKKKCYPDNCFITETRCEVKMQDLLNHTTNRLFLISNLNIEENGIKSFEILYKWGCDGSNGQSLYKQSFNNSSTVAYTDSNLFLFSIVPLQLQSVDINNIKNVIWKNNRTSSTRFCRPIKFEFEKETKETTLIEVNAIEDQIKQLTPTSIKINDKEFFVHHKLMFTMVDGKVCNSMTNTSSQKCFICGSSPKQMNYIDEVKQFDVNEETFKFGLSTLHAWIRFFECLLHVSYRLEFKTWTVRSPEHKKQFAARKKYIQDQFRAELGLLVDVVLQGKGNTNDGNTARKFFKHAEKSAEITGLQLSLIRRCGTVLSAMASGYTINIEAFDQYALDTARLFVNLYPWYYMPASMHKILIHGADVIRFAILPIGTLSEEAQEARNKDYKNYREHHTRKNSRLNTNEDLFNMLLVSSDPYISSLRNSPKKKTEKLSDDVRTLIITDDDYDQLNDSFSEINLTI